MFRRAAFASWFLVTLVATAAVGADGLEELRDRSSGRLFAIRVTPPAIPAVGAAAPRDAATLRATADAFIAEHRDRIGIDAPERDLVASAPETDALGFSRVKYFQKHEGLDVLGGEVTVHMNRAGQVYYVKAKVADILPTSTNPTFTLRQAKAAALDLAAAAAGKMELGVGDSELVVLPLGLIHNTPDTDSYLAWRIEVLDAASNGDGFSKTYFFDAAKNGEEILELEGHLRVTRQIYDCAGGSGSTCQLDVQSTLFPGYYHGRSESMPVRGPYPNPSLPLYFNSADVDTMYDLLGDLHDYYSATFGINGPNGFGGMADWPSVPQNITRGVAHNDSRAAGDIGCPSTVALWARNTGSIYVCAKMATVDVVAHEYAHSIVHHSFHDGDGYPIGPTYYGQAGALNEAYGEFMGELFQRVHTGSTDWRGGTNNPYGPFTDLANPPSVTYGTTPYPNRFHDSNLYCGTADAGGVHANLTVPGHAFYLIAEGGEHNGCDIAPQGIDVAQQIFFRGWRTYFSSSPTFNEAYADLIQACTDLYPASVVAEVTKALQSVEMDQPGLCSGIPEVAPPCAVQHGGSFFATRSANMDSATVFAPGVDIWARGLNGTANRTVDVRLLPHVANRVIWSEMHTTPAVSFTTGVDGTYWAFAATAIDPGTFDLVIDGNRDGFYQPWADSQTTVTVEIPTDVTQSHPWVRPVAGPSPFRDRTVISYGMPMAAPVEIAIYNLRGQKIRTILSETQRPGSHEAAWDGRDATGQLTAAGVYLYRVRIGDTTRSGKIVAVR